MILVFSLGMFAQSCKVEVYSLPCWTARSDVDVQIVRGFWHSLWSVRPVALLTLDSSQSTLLLRAFLLSWMRIPFEVLRVQDSYGWAVDCLFVVQCLMLASKYTTGQ